MSEVFGQDILLDADFQPVVAATGELVLTDGAETGEQDVRLRLFTRLGTLFYDSGFGSLVHDWIREENSVASRMGFEAEVARRLRQDPRVDPGSAACAIVSWDERGITAEASWRFIGEDEDHERNLVIAVGASDGKIKVVIQDVQVAG